MTAPLWHGEPIAVLVDEAAIGDNARVDALLKALGLQVIVVGGHRTTIVTPAVGVFGDHCPPVRGCHAWYVGPGPAPPWMHPTLGRGPATTAQILRMFGTALVQEQAAVA